MFAVLSLDISPTSTGACLMHRDTDITCALKVASSHEWTRMVSLIINFVRCSHEELLYPVFIESYAFGKFSQSSSVSTIAEITGAVKYNLLDVGYEIYLVSPGTIKKWVTGSGKAKKDEMRLAVFKKYNKEFETIDEIDSFSLADFGWHLGMEPKRKLTKLENEIIDKYRKANK
jgi:hypothetical protein